MYIWLYMYEYSSATRHQSQPLSRSAFHVMIFQVALCCRRWTVTLRNVPSSAVPWQIGFQHVNVPTTSPPTAPSFWTGEAIVDGKARPVFKDPVTDQGDCDRIWLVEWCCDGVLVCFKLNVFVGVFFHFGWQRRAFRMPCEARSPNRAVEVGEAPLGPGPGEAFLRRVFQLNEAMWSKRINDWRFVWFSELDKLDKLKSESRLQRLSEASCTTAYHGWVDSPPLIWGQGVITTLTDGQGDPKEDLLVDVFKNGGPPQICTQPCHVQILVNCQLVFDGFCMVLYRLIRWWVCWSPNPCWKFEKWEHTQKSG